MSSVAHFTFKAGGRWYYLSVLTAMHGLLTAAAGPGDPYLWDVTFSELPTLDRSWRHSHAGQAHVAKPVSVLATGIRQDLALGVRQGVIW